MSSVKQQFVLLVLASTLSSAALAQSSVHLVVGVEQQAVQTPAQSSSAGISYLQTGAATSTLNVFTKGFLFCANVSPVNISQSPVTLALAHQDQSFATAHPWTFLPATDVLSVGYASDGLTVNTAADTSLFCRGTDEFGQVPNGLSEGVFDEGFDSTTERNYNHLVNWIPSRGFSWEAPDWSIVPQDGCDTLSAAHVNEDVACAAVTGVSPPPSLRAATMWTHTDGLNFTYLFRLDGRAGPQSPNRQVVFQLPQLVESTADVDPTHPIIRIVDAFEGGDNGNVGYLGRTGNYCFLLDTELPTSLTSSVCNGHSPLPLDGNLNQQIIMGAAPIGTGVTQSYYVAVTRPVVSGHPNLITPVVGVAVVIDPAVASVGGDRFRGDDIVYGFIQGSSGFPWMTGQ